MLANSVVKGLDNKQNMVAIIAKGGKVLSVGTNDMTKTHTIFWNGSHDKGIHAEYDAIRNMKHSRGYGQKYNRIANGCDMYIFRFKKSGGFGDSKPCESCCKIIDESGVSRLYYYMNGKFIKEATKSGE